MSCATAHLDVETRSTVDLKKAGLYRYFEDQTTEVICVRFRIGDGPVLGENDLAILDKHIAEGGLVVGHNIAFDRTAWNTLRREPLPVNQTDCTMARCAALNTPQGLEQAGAVLKAKITKDRAGHALMMRMCKPRSLSPLTWWDDEERKVKLGEYCAQDVSSECEIDRIVPPLSPSERQVWLLDQRINERGVQIDLEAVQRARAVAELLVADADAKMCAVTRGKVRRCSEVAKLVAWISSKGYLCETVAKGETEDLELVVDMFDDEDVRLALDLRRAAAKSSLAKYTAMANSVCRDGRVRGAFNYHGASTGRWAGRLIQLHNMPRIGDGAADVEEMLDVLARHTPGAAAMQLAKRFEQPLDVLSKALRSMLVAAEGKRFIGGDYSNIEGRVAAWLAGEDWKVEAFAAYDAGEGADLYKLAYARAFGFEVDKIDGPQRQIGKVMELSMGYQGGVRAFQKMAVNYGVRVSDERADDLKRAWRDAHPNIVQGWYALQDAAIQAVREPGLKVPVFGQRVVYLVRGGVLWCKLPSGRKLSYLRPRIVWSEATDERPSRPQVEFDGVDSMTKKWGPHRLYGGLQFENIVQAVARDILVEGMFRLEASGYAIVLHVHDENVCELEEGVGSASELETLMTQVPTWAASLPVAVKGWEDYRYVK